MVMNFCWGGQSNQTRGETKEGRKEANQHRAQHGAPIDQASDVTHGPLGGGHMGGGMKP